MAINWKQVKTAAKRQDKQQVYGRTASGVPLGADSAQISERSGLDWDAVRANAKQLDQAQAQSQTRKNAYANDYAEAYEKYKKIYAGSRARARQQQRIADTSNRDVDTDILTSRQKEQEGLFRKYVQAMDAAEGRERQTRRIMDTGDEFGAEPNANAQALRDGWQSSGQRARQAAAQQNALQDQARGQQRTAYELGKQIEQLETELNDNHFRQTMLDENGQAYYIDENGNKVRSRSTEELNREIAALRSRQQEVSQDYTAASLAARKQDILALAYAPEEWTQEQKDAAREILGTQRGAGGLLGQERAVYAFEPYIQALQSGNDKEAAEWSGIYDMLYSRLYSGQTAVSSGLMQGLGVASASEAIGAALGADTYNAAYESYKKSVQQAQAEHPVLAGAANMAGSLALMGTINGAVGGASGALLGEKAAGMGKLAKTALSMGQTAITFAAKDAIQNAGAYALGEKSGSDYARDILVSGAGGAAGTLVSGLTATKMADWLRKNGHMTAFWEFVRQSASAFTFSGISIAAEAALGSEKKNADEVATELGTAFLFSLVNGYVGAMRESGMASRAVEQKYQQIEQQFSALSQHLSGKTYKTEEEFTQLIEDLRKNVQSLRQEVSGTYYAGQQSFVNQMTAALDRVDYNLLSMIPGSEAAQAAAGAAQAAEAFQSGLGAAADTKLLEEATEALSGGAAAPTAPTAPMTPEAPAIPESTAAQPETAKTAGMAASAGTEAVFQQYNAVMDAQERAAAQQEQDFAKFNEYKDEQEARLAAVRQEAESERSTDAYGQNNGGSDGEGRPEGIYTGGQAGGVEARTEIGRTLERQREAARLRNRAQDLGAENISPKEAGLSRGSTTKSLLKIPEKAYGEHEKALQKAVEDRGAKLNIVMGRIYLDNGTAVDEFINTQTKQITVRADCTKWSAENLIDHALFHGLDAEQRNAAAQAVAEQFSESELTAIAAQYVKRMRGVYDDLSEQERMDIAIEEVLADANGRMLRYEDADATKFTQTVRQILSTPTVQKSRPAAQDAQRTAERYSIEKTTDNKPFVEVERDILAGVPEEDWVSTVKENLKKKFPDGIRVGNNEIRIDGKSRQEMTYSRYMQWLYNNDPQMHADKLRATDNANEILSASTDWVNEGLNHPRKDRITDFARGNVLIRVGGNDYTADVVVGTRKNGNMVLYDVLNMKPTTFTKREADAAISTNPSPGAARSTASVSEPSIRSSERKSQEKFSVAEETTPQENDKAALAYFGRTYKWNETGYVLLNGARLDFSGRHEGGSGGYRSVDHRDIIDALGEDYGGDSYTGGMVRFMQEGNIRISPESGGINLAVMPTKAQMDALSDFISKERGEVILDIDDENGNTISSTEYSRGTHANKILQDIRSYFNDGTVPQVSSEPTVGQFRYSAAEEAGADEAADTKATVDERTPVFNFDPKFDWAYGADGNAIYRLAGITPPGIKASIENRAARAADWRANGQAYSKALLAEVTRPDRSTKKLTLTFPEGDGTYHTETVQNTKYMQDVYATYAEATPEDARLDAETFWMMRRKIADGSFSTRIETMSAEAKAQELQKAERNDFKGTGALEKMGVKVQRSVGRYGNTQSLIEMDKAYKQAKKELKRATVKFAASAKEIAVARMISDGIFDGSDIPRGYDRRVVMKLVDYMNAEAALGKDRILEQRKVIRKETTDVIEALFSGTKDGKVPDMLTLNHRTAQRNMRSIFGDEAGERINKVIFDPIQNNEAERIRFINRQFDDVREFEDSTGKKSELTHVESILVQLTMEGKATVALLGDMPGEPAISKAGLKIADGMKPNAAAKSEHLNKKEKELAKMYASWVSALRMMADGKVDAVKIDNAVKAYTKKYNEFYAAINDFLVAHGYEPIGFIQNYAPHMQSEESRSALDSALKMLGINEDTVTLPTSIAGLTANFKPNKRWNPYFLHRTGETYNFDAAKGFESYVAYMSEVLYHTDDIMTLRATSDYFRRRYSQEEISQSIDEYTWLREKAPDEQLLYFQQKGKVAAGTIIDANELDQMIDKELGELYKNAQNKSRYSNVVVWLDNYTNILAGKQTAGDRAPEADFGRNMLNIGNKLTRGFGAAKVAGNFATILNQTAQIPNIIGEKGVRNTAQAAWDMVSGKLRKADFTLESDYLTSKDGVQFLVEDEKNMYEWALDKVGQAQQFMDAAVSTIAVRAAYLEGIKQGMTHKQAMQYADKYGAAVMGDRSKGAKPVAFHSKNPIMQIINTFQLEVANSWEHLTQETLGYDFRKMAERVGKENAVRALAGIIVKMLLAGFILNRVTDWLYGGTPAQFDVIGITSNFVAGGYGLTVNDALRTVIDNGWEKLTGERLFGTDGEKREFDVLRGLEAAGGDIANDIPYLQNASAMIGWGDNSLPAAIPTKALDNWINAVKSGKSAADIAKKTFDVGVEVTPGGSQIKKTSRGIEALVRGGVYDGYGENEKLRYPIDNRNIGKWIQAVVFGPNGLSETGRYYAGTDRALSEKQTTAYKAMIAAGADKDDSYGLIRRIGKLGEGEDTKFAKLELLLGSDVSKAGQGAYYYIMMAGDTERERIDALTGENGTISMEMYMNAEREKLRLDADESMKATERANAFRQWVNQQGYSAEQKNAILNAMKFAQVVMTGGGHSELYTAAREGVSEYETLRADAVKQAKADGKTRSQAEESVNNDLRRDLKQDYLDGLIDEDEASEFLKEYTGADDNDVYWTLEEWKGGTEWKKYGEFLDAADKGVLADTKAVAKKYMKHGVDKKTLSAQLTNHFKEAYLEAEGEEKQRIRAAYISAYKAIGGEHSKAVDNLIEWQRDAKKKGAKK